MARGVPDAVDRGAIRNVVVADYPAKRTHPYKEGDKRRSMKVVADEVAPSLRFATAKVAKTDRSRPAAGNGSRGQAEADPWAADAPGSYSDEPPF